MDSSSSSPARDSHSQLGPENSLFSISSDLNPQQPASPQQKPTTYTPTPAEAREDNTHQLTPGDLNHLLNILEELPPEDDPEWEIITARYNAYARDNSRSEFTNESLKHAYMNSRIQLPESPNFPAAEETHEPIIPRGIGQVTLGDDFPLFEGEDEEQDEIMPEDSRSTFGIQSPTPSIPQSESLIEHDSLVGVLVDRLLRQNTAFKIQALKMQVKRANIEVLELREENRKLKLDYAREEAKARNVEGRVEIRELRAENRELRAENRRLIVELGEARAFIRFLERPNHGRKRYREVDDY